MVGSFQLFLENKINLEDFLRFVKSQKLEKQFLEFIAKNYKPEYFQKIKEFTNLAYQTVSFSFPIIGEKESVINQGIVVYPEFECSLPSNSENPSVNKRIKELSNNQKIFVIFKDNVFSGLSFSGAFYIAISLKKNIDKILISFEIDKDKNIYKVSKLEKKSELAERYGVPFITRDDFESVDDAIFMVERIYQHMNQIKNTQSFKVDIHKKYIIFGYSIKELRQTALSILKYLYTLSKPAIILDKHKDGIKTQFKMIDITNFNQEDIQNIQDYFIVITDNIEVATNLKQHTIIQNLMENNSLYQVIDSYIRQIIKEENIKPEIINKIINLSKFYVNGIPAEKLNFDKVPSLIYEDNLIYKFKHQNFYEYFLARYFLEFATKKEREELLDKINPRFVLFHPELAKLDKKTAINLINKIYKTPQFRNLYSQEYETFIELSKKHKLREIVNYEKAKKAYEEAKYKIAIKSLKNIRNKRADILKANILIDLWALDEAMHIVKNLRIEAYKKYGPLIYIYLKKGELDKAFYYLRKKLKYKDDKQKESYHILLLAYNYRLNPSKENKDKLLENFDNYLRNFEIGFKNGNYNKQDIFYLLRNFSYSLIDHEIYDRYSFEPKHIETIKPLYPLLINYAYIKKDIKLLSELANTNYFNKQPVENIAALTALTILTKEHQEHIKERYKKLVDYFNNLLKPLNISTQLNYQLEDINMFFRKFVYIQ